MRKLTALFLAFILCTGLFSLTANAIANQQTVRPKEVYSGVCGADISWSIDSETGLLKIIGTGLIAECSWASYKEQIKEVFMSSGITNIPYGAFSEYTYLSKITISDTVTTIRDKSFYACTSLTDLYIPESVTLIEGWAFWNCVNLETVFISGPAKIESNAFRGCDSVKDLTLDSGLSYTGDFSLPNADNVYINDLSAWCGANLSTYGGVPVRGAENVYVNGKLLTDLIIPDGVTAINNYTFSEIESIKSVTIPTSVTDINGGAFDECTNIDYVYINSSSIAMKLNAFSACGDLIRYADAILFNESITNINSYITNEYDYTESLIYNGKTYNCYSKHEHLWEDCNLEANGCGTPGFEGERCVICSLRKGNDVTVEHNYSTLWMGNNNKHWHECTECGERADIAKHEYDNACDTDCNSCGSVRDITHGYPIQWSTDDDNHWHECIICGDKTDDGAHVYDDDHDADCNTCSNEREVSTTLLGDVNLDGVVDSLDAAQVLKHDALIITLEGDGLLAADVNADGMVDSLDAALILKFDAGLITEFNV